MVVEDTGALPHYWEFNQSEGRSHFVDSLWSMEDVYGGIAVPIWCTYREVRRSDLVVRLDGHGADELLCGYPWTLDWHYGDMNNNLYNDFHVGVLPAILRNFDRCSMAHGVEILTPFLDYPLVCFLFG
jgi:asparagine synthetase B (glutamine-hydrolysing)